MPLPYKRMSLEDFKKEVQENLIPVFEDNDYQTWEEEQEFESRFVDRHNNHVNFGWSQNMSYEEKDRYNHPMKSLMGFHYIEPIGLPFLGVIAGADDNYPLFYIFYPTTDGFGAFIPTDGNIWNTDDFCAYGPDDDVYSNLAKRYPGMGFEDMDTDYDPMALELDQLFIPQAVLLEIARVFKGNSTEDIKLKEYEVILYPCAKVKVNCVGAANPQQAIEEALKVANFKCSIDESTNTSLEYPHENIYCVKLKRGSRWTRYDQGFKKVKDYFD